MEIKVIVLSFLLFSCGRFRESPLFETPQPKEENELNEIPEKLIGTYESLVDSSFLFITNKEVIIKNIFNVNASMAELDSSVRINLKDTIYKDVKSSLTVKVTPDSIFQHRVAFDTLYCVSNKYAIKKSKGYYFFNKMFRGKWIVRTLRITNYGILTSTLKSKENMTALDDYSSIEPDSISPTAPSLEELRRFLADEKFKDEWKFVRIEYGIKQKL